MKVRYTDGPTDVLRMYYCNPAGGWGGKLCVTVDVEGFIECNSLWNGPHTSLLGQSCCSAGQG